MKREQGNILVMVALALIALISISIAAYLFLENQKLKTGTKISGNEERVAPETVAKPNNSEELVTANWKSYRLGTTLRFKAPADWFSEGPGTFNGTGQVISLSPKPIPRPSDALPLFVIGFRESSTRADLIKNNIGDITISSEKNIVINGISGTMIEGEVVNAMMGNWKIKLATFEANGNVYYLQTYSPTIEQETYNLILSSFVIDKVSGITETTKTYTNKEFHFRIKYPSSWTAVEQGTTIYPSQGNVAISSPEATDGVVTIFWGGGFGGGPCLGEHKLVVTKSGSIDMCKITYPDGSENMTRANDAKGETYEDPNTQALMFSVSLKKSASEEKALEVLKTFEIYYLPD
jgi:hypothetical protein